jgi:hypothetical protein
VLVDSSVGGNTFGGRGGRGAGGGIFAIGPVGWRFQVSTDGTTWSEPLAEGTSQGLASTVAISIKPVEAKFIRITQTASPTQPVGWAVQRVRIFAIQ